MIKKILLISVLSTLLITPPCFPQQQANDSIVSAKKFQYGLFFSSELLPKLKGYYISYQKRSIGYGSGISLTYNINKNYAINFYTEILKYNLYYENKYTDTLKKYIIGEINDDFLMMRSNLSFKYSFHKKNILFYLKVGVENTSVSPISRSSEFVSMTDSILSSNYNRYKTPLKYLFTITDIQHYMNFIGIAVSPGVSVLSFKKFQLYSELDIRYNGNRLMFDEWNKRISLGVKIGIDF